MIIVPEGQGTTVIWDPFNDVNAPWIWFTEFAVAYEEMVNDVIDVPGMSSMTVLVEHESNTLMPQQNSTTQRRIHNTSATQRRTCNH